ncbi:MAG: class I SAM-dependent methyltransferase [Bdellovibrionota bacterium]
MMKYEDISPSSLLGDQNAAMMQDVAMLQGRRREFVEVACPACAGSRRTSLYEKYGMQHVACGDCETQYISPRPTTKVLRDFYAHSKNYEYWAKHIFPATAEVRRERIFKPRAKLIADLSRQHGARPGLLMEVGAGYGFFCEEIGKLQVFDRVVGIEPTPHLAEICRKKGIETIESVIEDVNLEVKADVVVNFEVIEHLFDPHAFLAACLERLNPKGHLILTCPNIAGFETQMLKRSSDTIDHEHLNYFSPASLKKLAERVGFQVIRVQTPGVLDVDIVYQRLKDQVKEGIEVDPFIQRILFSQDESLRDQFQKFLTEAGLSSNMMLIAQKPR